MNLNHKMRHPLQDYNNRRRYWELKNALLEKHEKMVLKAYRQYLKEQRDRILEAMGQKSSEFFNKEEEKRLLKTAMFPVLERVMREEGQEVAGRFGTEFTFTQEMGSWLENRAEVFSGQVTDTTFDQISREIATGTDRGETFAQIGERINSKVDEISKGRATVIARTETHGAQQKSNFEGYRQALPGGIKIWVSVMDGSTRDSHAAIDGQEKPIDTPFDNGLQFPGDPSGSPEETINCRCQL
jgi:hypothetical protein